MNIDKHVAQLMCNAIQEIMVPYFKNEPGDSKCDSVSCRVGSGKRTYYRNENGNHLFVFGELMIKDKRTDYKSLSRWLSSREILSKGFFDGELTIKNSIAHTVCHEFAHFISRIRHGVIRTGFKRGFKRVIHGPEFYSILTEMKKNGIHNQVLEYLNRNDIFNTLSFTSNVDDSNLITRKNILFNNYVKFAHNGDNYVCKVIKPNPVTAKVAAYIVNRFGVASSRIPAVCAISYGLLKPCTVDEFIKATNGK